MLRIPQNDESDDMGSDIGLTPMESSSITPSRGFKMIMEPRRRRRWYSYILVVILLIVIVLIIRPSVRGPHVQSGSYPIDFLQTLKVQDQNFYNTTSRRDYRQRVLCQLLGDANCQSHYIADVMDLVWVIAPLYCFDPESDWKLYEMHKYFKSYIQSFGLNFITIEAIRFPGDRDKRPWSNEASQYTATVAGNEPYDIQVHYYNVSYLRENLLNVAIRKLDKQRPWEYILWIDAHQLFENVLWWEESIIKLEKYKALQLFSTLQYIGYDNITKFPEKRPSILRCSLLSTVPVVMPPVDFVIVPGNAWGIRKDVYNAIGTIYDECIGTSCDCAYTLASFPDGITFDPLYVPYYYNFDAWINHTKSIIKGNRGYVSGNIIHMAHGHAFPYGELQESLNKYNFNATLHLKRDENFTLYITNDTISSGLDKIILKSKHDHPMSRS